MKRLVLTAIICLVPCSAGVVRFTAKHGAAAVKVTAKAAGKTVAKTARVAAKILY